MELELKVICSPLLGAAGAKVKEAAGGRLAIWIVLLATLEAPLLSITSSLTVCEPGSANWYCAWFPAPSLKLPSPSKSQAWLAIVPSGSVALEVNVI